VNEPRQLVALTTDECRNLLTQHQVGRVVFMDARGPMALPVNSVVDHEDIVFRTDVWSSLFATPTTGKVSFEVDEIDEHERLSALRKGLPTLGAATSTPDTGCPWITDQRESRSCNV
jgi:nitroimidazol reductase NimA-like FMN-containing flavoprotein (pyridoxamine 5'-phosphate oxidase superfamily)